MPTTTEAARADERLARDIERQMRLFAQALNRGRRVARKRKGARLGGGGFSHKGRTARAPGSASQFRYNHSYSRRSGKRKCPSSAVGKIKYDFDLNGDPQNSRLAYFFVSSPANLPAQALDPLAVARASERAERNVNWRLMAHDTISLPADLSIEGRQALARRISDEIRAATGGQVPVFTAMHSPDSGERNWHLHISYPTRNILPAGRDGAFRLGEKTPFEQQQKWRIKHGLAPTNRDDLKALRAAIAGACADALKNENAEHNLVERWRWGWLRLNVGESDTQVSKAQERGDSLFVKEN